MTKEIRELQLSLLLKKDKLLAAEEYNSWRNWHCNNPYCGSHMCYVRYMRMKEINLKVRDIDVKLCMIRHNQRYGTNYKVSANFPALS